MERWGLRVSLWKALRHLPGTPRNAQRASRPIWRRSPCWAVVKYAGTAAPGSGVQYESKVSPGRLPSGTRLMWKLRCSGRFPRASRLGGDR